MEIRIATTDHEIAACFPVMHELRPHLDAASFVSRVRSQERSGYRLAVCYAATGPVAVAGFRLGESLAWGRYLYVDDLVTLASQRSRGHGAALLSWLTDHAREQGCGQLHLDSGVQREDAHRFYRREGQQLAAYHFAGHIDTDATPGTPT
jgi:GNAT superfamily N-acetyltransferase